MISIYASKMYRSKSFEERSKIKSAIENPVNAELVKQIKTYLDIPEEPREEPKEKSTPGVDTVDTHEAESAEQTKLNPSPAKFTPSVAAPHAPSDEAEKPEESEGPVDTSHDIDDDKSQVEEPEAPEELKKAESELTEDERDDTDSSTKPVKSSTGIFQLEHSKIANAVEEIQGMLNLQDTTAGVSRINVKDNEFWIYYNDDVNLNKTMGAVLELLNASGYNYLTFNRLARSNNAIVFEISFLDTDNKMQPRKDVEDGKKD